MELCQQNSTQTSYVFGTKQLHRGDSKTKIRARFSSKMDPSNCTEIYLVPQRLQNHPNTLVGLLIDNPNGIRWLKRTELSDLCKKWSFEHSNILYRWRRVVWPNLVGGKFRDLGYTKMCIDRRLDLTACNENHTCSVFYYRVLSITGSYERAVK